METRPVIDQSNADKYFEQFNYKEKKYFQIITENLANNYPVDQNPHYLFLLGTGVDYVPKPQSPKNNNECYFQGEFLSYSAQVTTTLLDEVPAVNPNAAYKMPAAAHAYHSSSVDVINGADGPGQEVGQRIAKALVIMLGEVAKGKTEFNVSGFSRGSVEAIVLMHEITRVRDALLADANLPESKRRSFGQIIIDSKSAPGTTLIGNKSWTHYELTKLVDDKKQPNDEQLKETLLKKLQAPAFNVKLFILDPVPGSDSNLVGKVIDWQEDCFYAPLPEFVKRQRVFIQKNETSYCFKPIVPKDMPYEILPGHHGAGDGNHRDHNTKDLPKEVIEKGHVSPVLHLVLRRWLKFMFPDLKAREINLAHPELDEITNEYFRNLDTKNRQISLLRNYKAILGNMKPYEYLNGQSYTGLGSYGKTRQIFYHGKGHTPVTDLDTHGDGQHFLNRKHAKLWMKSIINNFNFYNLPLAEQIKILNQKINNVFVPNPVFDMTQSQIEVENPIAKLIETGEDKAVESVSILINSVAQSYLRNNLAPQERLICRNYVQSTLDLLNNAENTNIEEKYKKFAVSLRTVFTRDLTRMLIEHQNSMLAMIDQQIKEQKLLINCTRIIPNDMNEENIKARAELENRLSLWLPATEKLYGDLDSLSQQIANLHTWCNIEDLSNQWREILNLPSDFNATPQMLILVLQQKIQDERKKLINSAVELNASMKIKFDAIDLKTNEFYRNVAKGIEFEKSDVTISNLNEQIKKLNIDSLLLESANTQSKKIYEELKDKWTFTMQKNEELNKENQIQKRNNEKQLTEFLKLNKEKEDLTKDYELLKKIKTRIADDYTEIEEKLENLEKNVVKEQQRKQRKKEDKIRIKNEIAEFEIIKVENKPVVTKEQILGIVIGKFLNFSAAYITKNTVSNQGSGYFFSSHGKNGRAIAMDFITLFTAEHKKMKSIEDIKNIFWQLVEDNMNKLSGSYNEGSFKTYLFAYATYLDTLIANDFDQVKIDDFDIDVNTFMSNFINRIKTEKIDIKTSFKETFKPVIGNNII